MIGNRVDLNRIVGMSLCVHVLSFVFHYYIKKKGEYIWATQKE
jgi:hypothetical protein